MQKASDQSGCGSLLVHNDPSHVPLRFLTDRFLSFRVATNTHLPMANHDGYRELKVWVKKEISDPELMRDWNSY